MYQDSSPYVLSEMIREARNLSANMRQVTYFTISKKTTLEYIYYIL
jgi:hypothetical protein